MSPSGPRRGSLLRRLRSASALMVVDVPLPRGVQRYVRAYYDVVGSNPTLGTLTAQLLVDSENRVDYASGIASSF